MILDILIKILGGFWKIKHLCNNCKYRYVKKYFYRPIYNGYLAEQGSHIPYSITFKGPAIFPHGIKGIFVSRYATIGKNAIIFQQVTIGSNILQDSQRMGAPTVGDNVLIGAGAKIIGKINIGNNCRIGANAVVTTDVPDNCVVVLEKPRIIQKEQLVNRFFCRPRKGWSYIDGNQKVLVTDPELIKLLEKNMP